MQRHTVQTVCILLLACASCLSQPAATKESTIQLDPAKTTVEFTLADVLHTVHGIFRLKSGNITFDSTGEAGGDVVIDAASGDSGSHARDKKMNKDILEVQRYPTIEFLPKHVLGSVAPQGQSQIQVQGTFRLHGSDHELTLAFPIRITGSQLATSTHFEIPYEAWGLKNPSTLFLRVSNKVQIDITASGVISAPSAVANSDRPRNNK
ncbi:MAG: YceI family protein [Acidobacteria bacterium]|nr:YceI family protein [Acidobacteriota bacterium]MBV9147857.1 YceI family protein [Acidobacteriota bacterium]MBV9435215.1 YceI family protein [Acidobacteriota bacterium]